MRSYEQVQAAVSVIVPKGEIRGNNGSQSNGLSRGESIASRSACVKVGLCNRPLACYAVRIRSKERVQAWKPADWY